MSGYDVVYRRGWRDTLRWSGLAHLRRPLLAVVAVVLGIATGLLAGEQPLLSLLLMTVVVVVPALIIWPDSATMLVVLLLYTNFVVVAVRFHGLPYAVAAFPLLLLAPLLFYIGIRRQPIVVYDTFPLLLGFILVQLLGSLLARDTQTALSNFVTFMTEGVLLYVVLINVVRTPETLSRVTWVLLLAGVLLTMAPLHQLLTDNFGSTYGGLAQLSERGFRTGEENLLGEVRQFRSAGAIGEQNRFAQILLMLVPLGLFIFASERPRGAVVRQDSPPSNALRLLALGAVAFILLGASLTFSRGGAVAAVLLLGFMVLLRMIKPYHFALVLLAIALILAALPQYQTRLLHLPTAATTTLLEGGNSEDADSSIEGRATEMMAAVYVFADHPLLGVGPGMFKFYSRDYGNELGIGFLDEQREAHSLYLDIAANHGLLGLITFFGIFYVTMRDLNRARKRLRRVRPRLAALCAGYLLVLASYLATGLFLHLSYARYLWLMLALAAAAAVIARQVEAAGGDASATTASANGQLHKQNAIPGDAN